MLLVVMDLRPLLSLTLGSFINKRAGIAQLVERNLDKVEVASSNLVSRSITTFALFSLGQENPFFQGAPLCFVGCHMQLWRENRNWVMKT